MFPCRHAGALNDFSREPPKSRRPASQWHAHSMTQFSLTMHANLLPVIFESPTPITLDTPIVVIPYLLCELESKLPKRAWGSIIGVTKGDTWSLDYCSFQEKRLRVEDALVSK